MSSTRPTGDPRMTVDRVEACDDCEGEMPHSVTIEMRAEGASIFSREPYRVAECLECGCETTWRMNNA
ncbi:DUF7835 family putative zinc beta-ribbon protein [Halorussus marinus]|uniref:DUF7835 family putative zinc beta-ribbon protein n=1 Tax=Halorussus marinus TaxID=2505976 RepID=UPI0010923B60|nr:hypothetical protein [Halorussus marinus]